MLYIKRIHDKYSIDSSNFFPQRFGDLRDNKVQNEFIPANDICNPQMDTTESVADHLDLQMIMQLHPILNNSQYRIEKRKYNLPNLDINFTLKVFSAQPKRTPNCK